MNKHYDKLIRTLRTLFEMDRADLDFGFYRIMHAKAEQVQEFIEKDLLQTVKEAFGEQSSQNTQELLEQARQKVIQTLGEDVLDADGNLKPSFSSIPAGKQYQDEVALILRQKNDASSETDVYDHLCRFFERYYEGGDFVSRRYYARETSGKAAPYAIPYNGEEVKLHWANADQYYIKTTENYNNFTFDLRQAREVQTALKNTPILAGLGKTDKEPLRVHFRIKEAVEGEHGNVKATDATKLFFVLHSEQPVEKDEAGELVVNFEYKPLPGGKYAIDAETEKQLKSLYGSMNKGDMPVFDMATQIFAAVEAMDGMAEYCRLLQVLSPTEKIKKRPLIVRYLNKYTAANTMDYFIHKDLGGFLRRELDFYIKNEVMHLDDIENADAPAVESYLARIKVLRTIAGKLIDFLAQLEDFQKKLWLKKKFVVECNYCLTLDRVPEALYGEIVDCDGQWLEWVGLGFLTTEDTESTEKRKEILEKEPYLVLDTKFYGECFKEKLLASVDNLDEQCDGLLIHSENFQGLQLLQKKYRKQIQCNYIDPPYNTDSTPILYKNGYCHSSWATLLKDRVTLAKSLLKHDGIKAVAIDDTEMVILSQILTGVYPEYRLSRVTVIHNPKGSITKDFNRVHEYAIFLTPEEEKGCIARTLEENDTPRKMRRWGENSLRTDRRLSFYPIYVRNGKIVRIGTVPDDEFHPNARNVHLESGEIEIWPIDQNGIERRWNFGLDSINANLDRITIIEVDDTLDLFLTHELTVPKTVWYGGDYDAGNHGNTLLINILGCKLFDFPKSIKLVQRCIYLATAGQKTGNILDYFAGSGTAGHATINLNREDNGNRKYVLIEMGQYFDTVLKPRIQKIIYSENWKDGKPQANATAKQKDNSVSSVSSVVKNKHNGISHTFKYLRLESYEDTLNNLRFDENKERDKVLAANPSLKDDYTLNYLLDVETRGSQSLLNIDDFADPRRYTLKVKKPGSEEYNTQNVDLIETFNYLIGLRVTHLAASQTFKAAFKRNPDPELPEDQHTKLVLDGTIRITTESTDYTETDNKKTFPCPSVSSVVPKNHWWFRKIEGWLPKDPANPNNGQKEKILIVWRNLTGDLEKDNAVLDEWFQKNRISTRDFEFDTIYVNGSNNLPNLQKEGDTWKVRLIEEEFMKRMWDVEGT